MAGVYISFCSHAEESPSVWNVLGRGIILIICILALLLFTTYFEVVTNWTAFCSVVF